MRPTLVFVLLCAAGALAATAVAQHVPSNARPHPAASAHANATSGTMGAARIEACTVATRRLLEQLERGDAGAATANFDAQMRGAMSPKQLADAWQSIGAHLGKLVGQKPAQNMLYHGMVIVTQPLQFEKGDLGLEMACNEGGRFAGMHFRALAPASAAVE